MIQSNIGFIGAGTMAEALIRGLLETNTCSPANLFAADVNEIRLAHMAKSYQLGTVASNKALASLCPVLILAVKPQQVGEVWEEIQDLMDPEHHVLVSIVAGLPTLWLESKAQVPLKVVRVMPNTPARLRAGATAYCLGQYAGESEAMLARALFEPIGVTVRIEEPFMDAVTALSGSGPAYVFKLCEMMVEAGTQMGISQAAAELLAVQTIFGAARMLKETGQTAAALRQAVTSPGGTTQAALEHLDQSDFSAVFQEALFAARDRGKKMGSALVKGQGVA